MKSNESNEHEGFQSLNLCYYTRFCRWITWKSIPHFCTRQRCAFVFLFLLARRIIILKDVFISFVAIFQLYQLKMCNENEMKWREKIVSKGKNHNPPLVCAMATDCLNNRHASEIEISLHMNYYETSNSLSLFIRE